MISHQHRCVFLHVPKTGGTSVEDAIWGPDRASRTPEMLWMGVERPYFNRYQTGGLQHLLATQVRTEVGDETYNSYYRFGFVRNPWDRAISQFLYLKQHAELRRFYGLGRFVSFAGYLRGLRDGLRDHHVQSYEQWRWFFDDGGECLVDFVGRFETLEQDFGRVAARVGIEATLPHAMRSSGRKSLEHYYDSESRGLIEALYARDIELFGYEFPGLGER